MKMKKNYFKLITNFNSDKEIIALREKYKEPTFFEIISKQRSENTYSSFLKWMFQSSSNDLNSVSPILLLLDILVKRGEEQGKLEQQNQIVYIDDNFKKQIVTRNFQLNSIEVETEKSVGVLVNELKKKWQETENSVDQDLLIKKCQDRIDIFIKCHLDNNQELQIIIENKIDSNEGLNKKQVQTGCNVYDKSLQTSRYYVATKRKNQETLKQLYVYLTPSLNNECECANFIKITYQDVIDGIIVPMLSTTSLSSRARFFLEELKTELTFPSLEGSNVKSSIAISNENSERFNKIWERHGNLIIDAAIATSESDIWYINYNNNCSYYDHAPKDELLELLDRLPQENKPSLGGNHKYKTVQDKIKVVKDLDLKSDLCKIDGDVNLLKMFWENNKRFLLALMNGLPETERKKIECLSAEVSKRDNTKYYVYYDGECKNKYYLGKDKPANNSETAWMIIALWASQKGSPVTLTQLREKFRPADCNKYYAKGDYLKHLFYDFNDKGEYIVDGDKIKGQVAEAGGWDFYKPKNDNDRKFRIKIKDDKDAIMLKVWRKSELNRLVELVTSDVQYFEGKLSVQPDR